MSNEMPRDWPIGDPIACEELERWLDAQDRQYNGYENDTDINT